MGWRINNGWRLPAGADPFGEIESLRRAVVPVQLVADAQEIADTAVSLADRFCLHRDLSRLPMRGDDTPVDLCWPVARHSHLVTAQPPDREHTMSFSTAVKSVVETGVFMSLGARDFRVNSFDDLIFDATILPFNKNGKRGERGRTMTVSVSAGKDDDGTLCVLVIYPERGTGRLLTHFEGETTIDGLNRTLLALDYDGDDVLNPEYAA